MFVLTIRYNTIEEELKIVITGKNEKIIPVEISIGYSFRTYFSLKYFYDIYKKITKSFDLEATNYLISDLIIYYLPFLSILKYAIYIDKRDKSKGRYDETYKRTLEKELNF